MAMFGGPSGRNGLGMNVGGDFGGGRPGFNDPGGLGEKLGIAGSAILGAYHGGAGALTLDALRQLHRQRGAGVPAAAPGPQPFNGHLGIDPLTARSGLI